MTIVVVSPCSSSLKDSCNSAGDSELPFQATSTSQSHATNRELSSLPWKHSP